MNLTAIKTKLEALFSKEGVAAEVTFINASQFSVFCEDAAQFVAAKNLLDLANQNYDSEACDAEIGFFAYYSF